MEKRPTRCTVASLLTVFLLVSLPVRSRCEEEVYKSLPECCIDGEDAELKRFDDIDYDSFVSLMGRRSAAQPNTNRHVDQILADVLGRSTRTACPCDEEYLQIRKSRFINHRGQRFQRFL